MLLILSNPPMKRHMLLTINLDTAKNKKYNTIK